MNTDIPTFNRSKEDSSILHTFAATPCSLNFLLLLPLKKHMPIRELYLKVPQY